MDIKVKYGDLEAAPSAYQKGVRAPGGPQTATERIMHLPPPELTALYWSNQVAKAREKGIKSVPGVDWWMAELEHWKQRCEELEIELECMRNAFPEDDHDVMPKHRGIF
jgi:hypothetical protein